MNRRGFRKGRGGRARLGGWRWPVVGNGFGFAIGANNLFDVDPPACFTCGLNNMDPTTYDVPGTFVYGRVTFRWGG